LIAAGEVIWVGLEPIGEKDGRIGLYLAEKLPELWPIGEVLSGRNLKINPQRPTAEKEAAIVEYLRTRGASFFQDLHDGVGGGYPGETLDALWELVWKGWVTNDGMAALRAYCQRSTTSVRRQRRVHQQTGFRSRRTTPPTAQGRWALQNAAFEEGRSGTAWSHAMAQQLLMRYGVVFRETAHAEDLPGGFSAIYDVMKALEESGKVRRGYFAADLGATQFALPAAVDLLRSLRTQAQPGKPEMLQLAAADPANPYGALLRWPDAGVSLTRSVGAQVILSSGALVAYLRRGNPNVQVFLPEEEPQRSHEMRNLAEFLVRRTQALEEESGQAGILIATVNGVATSQHEMARPLLDAGFTAGAKGFHVRRKSPRQA
jgi:ATP-dependent Lhr-like helicase